MQYILVFLTLVLMSCGHTTDRDKLVEFTRDQVELGIVKLISDSNSITRVDQSGFFYDKHWFDKDERLILYSFYNRNYKTNKAYYIARFDEDMDVTSSQGTPLYIQSNVHNTDTIRVDTLVSNIYWASSPFLKSKVRIYTNYKLDDELYVTENKYNDPLMRYKHDVSKLEEQEVEYTYYYLQDDIIIDSLKIPLFIKHD